MIVTRTRIDTMATKTDAPSPGDACRDCNSWTGKHCGHAVLYGPGACWRRDGRPERKVGLEGCESPYAETEQEF